MKQSLARAYGEPLAQALLKATPEDFVVDEQFAFTPAGQGEHLYLQIEKRDLNTQDVVKWLAAVAGIRQDAIGFSGMKDKRAVTRQWFSLHLLKQQTLALPAHAQLTVLRQERHTQKLRRASHQRNAFVICLRQLQGDRNALEARLAQIRSGGVPNYVGEQRFGRNGDNLRQADTLVARSKGKQQRHHDRLLVSAMRSWIFNLVLSERVLQDTWQQSLEGDPQPEPTGPLWGRGRLPSKAGVAEMEARIARHHAAWCEFLEHCGLQQERRLLQLAVSDMTWHIDNDTLQLAFSLPAGTYATSVLRELVSVNMEA